MFAPPNLFTASRKKNLSVVTGARARTRAHATKDTDRQKEKTRGRKEGNDVSATILVRPSTDGSTMELGRITLA